MQRPSILQLEQSFLSAWPALEEHVDSGWLWRASNGYTKRANSAQAMDPDDAVGCAGRLTAFAAWARARRNAPIFRVTPLAHTGVIAALNQADWRNFETSVVMASPVGALFSPKHSYVLLNPATPEWFETQAALSGYDGQSIAALSEVLARIDVPVAGVLLHDEHGAPAAAALTAISAGIGVYLNVVVRSDLRTQGYGRSVMQGALNWSRRMGAQWGALQVVADNAAALALYRGLGFEEVYRYHYRRGPEVLGV